MTDTLPVSEVFDRATIQGEGPHAGRCAMFIRFMGCNLSCEWCDTAWTWDNTRFDLRAGTTAMTAGEIVDRVRMVAAPVVVLTGGEPLLHQYRPAWFELIDRLRAAGHEVHLETNGTIPPNDVTLGGATAIAVSPKPEHAGAHRGHQDPTWDLRWVAAARWHPGVFFKLVVREPEEVEGRVRALVAAGLPRDRLWFMPEGATADEITKRWPSIAAAAAAHGVNATHRLHVLAWGEERGR